MSEQEPTIVLVHDACADSSSWNGVVDALQSHGHPVVAASNPLRGLAVDSDYVGQLVASIDGPVVLAARRASSTSSSPLTSRRRLRRSWPPPSGR